MKKNKFELYLENEIDRAQRNVFRDMNDTSVEFHLKSSFQYGFHGGLRRGFEMALEEYKKWRTMEDEKR